MLREGGELMDEDLSHRIELLEQELAAIKLRNASVESDKAWETSSARIGAIAGTTYFIVSCVFWVIGVESPLINAIIPTLGYLLSTQSMPKLKSIWLQNRHRRAN